MAETGGNIISLQRSIVKTRSVVCVSVCLLVTKTDEPIEAVWGMDWNGPREAYIAVIGNVTSAGRQVTLCEPIWHVSFRSGEASCYLLYSYVT